jgi:hypothetical protein
MYNLTVAQAHTYYVGDGQWLVHNQGRSAAPASLLTPEQIAKSVELIQKGGMVTVKNTAQARQILDAIPGAKPLPTQFGMEDSIFKYPTYRGDLIGTTEELYDNGLIHPEGAHRSFPHYNIKFPKSQGGKDGLIKITTAGCP